MLDKHQQQNEEWIEKMRLENDSERRALAHERVSRRGVLKGV